MVRVVIDTNVLVSTLINDGPSRKLVLNLLEEHTVIVSRRMLAELADVVIRDKFAIKNSQVDRFLSILLKKSKIVSDTPHFKVVSEDPDDDKVLDTAYNGKADYIVTGDRHLLALKRFKRTQILTVTQMLKILS